MADEIINKVANSGLIQIDLEEYYPQEEIVTISLSDFLYEGLILREKEYRAQLKDIDWSIYQNKIVLIQMPQEAIVPSWAALLLSSYLVGNAKKTHIGDLKGFLQSHYHDYITQMDVEKFRDQRIIIKGCAKKQVPESAFVQLLSKLQPMVKSIMYGEACSTVPLWKRKT